MKNSKKQILPGIVFLALALVISNAAAFGVSSPYWENNPLIMGKGETKTIYLNLQNMVGEEDVTIKARIVEGSDIVSLKKDIFIVKAKTSDTLIPVKISIPRDSEEGSTEKIKIEFKTINSDKKGISVGTGMTVAFNVSVEEAKKTSGNRMILIIAVILALAGLLVILNKKEKKSRI